MTIRIKASAYTNILMGMTGNAIADEIPAILFQRIQAGDEVIVVDDFTGVVIERFDSLPTT
jgi:hypothetical protein